MTSPKTPQAPIYAVITGDIVGSTNLSAKQLAEVRKTLSAAVRSFPNHCVLKGPEFFRGDSWQVLLEEPKDALNLTLLIQADLTSKLNVQTRAAIGIGAVINIDKTLATSTGEAFILSGHALENVTGNTRLTGALPARAEQLQPWFPAVVHICGGLASDWTRRQAEVMGLWLSQAISHELIGQRLKPPVTKQSVGNILASANWHYLYEAMKAFHATDWQFLSRTGEDAASATGGKA